MRKHWKKILTIFLLLLVLAYIFVCNILVDVALIPEKMEQTQAFEDVTKESYEAMVQTNDIKQNEARAWEETNAWLQNAGGESWKITTEDGYNLEGAAFLQKEGGRRWVLLLHGYTGWKEEMYPIAYEYAKRGYQVLVPDMRCSGESQGDFIGMGWLDKADNLIWIQRIIQQDSEAEIIIHGQSMGASAGLMLTGEKLPSQVKAVVSDSAYTDAFSMFQKQLMDWFHLPSFPLLDGANLMLQLRGGYNLKEASALLAVEKSSLPLLLIHGEEDAFVPARMAKELYAAGNCKKELLMVPGAGHTQAAYKNPVLYYDTVFSFLEENS